MSTTLRRIGATALLTVALAVGGTVTAAAASATETQSFTGFSFGPDAYNTIVAARYRAAQAATAAGYDPGTQCHETNVHLSAPSAVSPQYAASSTLECTR